MQLFKRLAAALSVLGLAACGYGDVTPVVSGPNQEFSASLVRGANLARTICAECHGENFLGAVKDSTYCPGLTGVRSMTLAQFNALLASGVEPDGGTANSLMTITQGLSEEDRVALYEYLKVVGVPE